MLELIFKLAALSDCVTIVIAKKGELIHLSIANSSSNADNKFKPILVSGTEQQLIDELPNITTQLKAFQGFASNLKSITDAADAKVKQKVEDSKKKAETTKTTTGGKQTEKSAPKSPTADLFANAEKSLSPTKQEEEEPEDNDETDDDGTDGIEVSTAITEAEVVEETPIANPLTEAPQPQVEAAEEEIF